MGHPCWARIQIGGDIPKSIIDELKEKLVNEFGPMDDNNYHYEVMLEEGAIFEAYDEEARYGHFGELEKFLIDHRIHFDVRCDSDPEWDFGLWQYRGEDPKPDALDENGKLKDDTSMMDFNTTDTNGWYVWRWEEIEKALRKVQTVIEYAMKQGETVTEENAINFLKLELKVEGKGELKELKFVEWLGEVGDE